MMRGREGEGVRVRERGWGKEGKKERGRGREEEREREFDKLLIYMIKFYWKWFVHKNIMATVKL